MHDFPISIVADPPGVGCIADSFLGYSMKIREVGIVNTFTQGMTFITVKYNCPITLQVVRSLDKALSTVNHCNQLYLLIANL